MSTPPHPSKPALVPELHVQTPDGRVFRFTQSFHIGRDHDCALRLNDVHVSRKHVAVTFENGEWRLRDLKSANGMFVKNRRVETASVDGGLSVTLGANGPTLTFEVESQGQATKRRAFLPQTVEQSAEDSQVLARYQERYFGSGADEGRVGGRTMMIRRAFEKVQKRQRRRHWIVVGALAVAGLAAAGFAFYKHRQVGQQQALAQDIFYAMKGLDVDIASMEVLIAQSGNAQAKEQARQYQARRRDLENSYRPVSVRAQSLRSETQRRRSPDSARHATVRRVRARRPSGVRRRGQELHREMAVVGALRQGDQAGAGHGIRATDRAGAHRSEPAAAILLPGAAGERLRSVHQRTADALGHRERHVAVHSGDGRALRPDHRTSREDGKTGSDGRP